jgi:hypothetical protein
MTTVPSHLICDFCLAGTPSAGFLVSAFEIDTPLEIFTNAEGAWAACGFCTPIIAADRLGDLVDRAMRLQEPRGLPQIPLVRQHFRMLFSAILQRRSDPLALDDPRIAPLQHPEGAPIGVHYVRGPDGRDRFVHLIPPAPPHPFRPGGSR